MTPPDTPAIVYSIITFVFGGGLTGLVTAIATNRRVKAEAQNAGAKTQPEINQLTVGTMGEVINNLQNDNKVLREERDKYMKRLQEMEERVAFLTTELSKVQAEIGRLLQEAVDDATEHINQAAPQA